jgi:hypothetical protein
LGVLLTVLKLLSVALVHMHSLEIIVITHAVAVEVGVLVMNIVLIQKVMRFDFKPLVIARIGLIKELAILFDQKLFFCLNVMRCWAH